MKTEEQARRFAYLMGLVYMVIWKMQVFNRPVTYSEIERVMREQEHCTPAELVQVCNELHLYNGLIEQAEKGI